MATPKDRAWYRQVEQNEAWDGEREIRAAAKRRFNAEYKANGPTIVSTSTYANGRSTTETQEFPTRRAAEAFADTQPDEVFVTVHAKRPRDRVVADLATGKTWVER